MGARVRHVSALLGGLLGGLAVGLAASALIAFGIEWQQEDAGGSWVVRLWISGGVAALVAVLLGLVARRKGFALPLGVFALLILATPVAFLFMVFGLNS